MYVLTAGFTGARAGELCALRKRDVEVLRRRITIRHSLADVAGKLQFGPPKNGEPRSFTIPPFLVEILAQHLTRVTGDDALVFTAPRGGPLRHNDWYKKHFVATVAALVDRGVFRKELRGLTFHSLRHSCASMLIKAGENPVAIAEQLGHAKPSITLNVYAHLFGDHDDARAAKLEGVWRETVSTRAVARASGTN